MPKRSNKFQKLITAIHACLVSDAFVEESAYLIDKETGEEREVDILLKSKFGDYSVLLSIEVIERSRRAGSGWVEEMSGKHKALPTDKLVLVSRSGFTKPALKKAKARGIETLTIEDACATDWNLAMRLEGKGVFQIFNIRFDCSAHVPGKSSWVPAPLSSQVFMPTGENSTVSDIVAFVMSNPEIKKAILDHFTETKEQEYHAVFNPPEGTLFEEAPNKNLGLIKLAIGLHLDFESTPVEFASGLFKEREIMYANATEPDQHLCIVMTKNKNGNSEGMLYDSKGFRRLFLDTQRTI